MLRIDCFVTWVPVAAHKPPVKTHDASHLAVPKLPSAFTSLAIRFPDHLEESKPGENASVLLVITPDEMVDELPRDNRSKISFTTLFKALISSSGSLALKKSPRLLIELCQTSSILLFGQEQLPSRKA